MKTLVIGFIVILAVYVTFSYTFAQSPEDSKISSKVTSVSPTSHANQKSSPIGSDIKLVVALISVAGILAAQFINSILTNRNQKRQRDLEIRGIMSALRSETRLYIKHLNNRLDKWFEKSGEPKEFTGLHLAVTNIKEPEIFKAYKDKFGSLGPLFSDQIVRFYSSLYSFQNQVNLILELYQDKQVPKEHIDGLRNLINNSLNRAKFLDAVLTKSIEKGLLSVKKQLKIESKAIDKI